MRRLHLSIEVVIDDHERVSIEKVSYDFRGRHDAPLASEEVKPESVMLEKQETKQEPNLSAATRTDILALLLSLGFNVDEGQTLIQAKTAERIKEVVKWVKTRNNVASPKALASKLFDQK